VEFKEVEKRTKGLIREFNEIADKKKDILKKLKSPDELTFNQLQELFFLLKRKEIPLLRIILGELNIINGNGTALDVTLDRLRDTVTVFIQRAEEDSSKVGEILTMIVAHNDKFYLGHPSRDNEIKAEIQKLAKLVKRDIKLEGRLEVGETTKILRRSLRLVQRNPVYRSSAGIIAEALRGPNLIRIAACFLAIWLALGVTQETYAAEQQKKTVTAAQINANKKHQFRDRGVKKARYYILRKTKGVAALIELGFISNDREALALLNTNTQNKAAQGIVLGIDAYAKAKKLKKEQIKIAIFPGHGAGDPGAVNKTATTRTITEHKIALSVSKRVASILKGQGFDVFVITPEGNTQKERLKNRVNDANKGGANVVIALHCDASSNKSVSGTTVFCISKSGEELANFTSKFVVSSMNN